jgi:hypothetical protein
MHSLATILTDLRAVLAARAAKDRALSALLALVWTRLYRMATRFERLVARWRAGTLPSPRPSRAGQPRKHTPKPNFPSAPAWLVARVGYTAAAYGSQLQHALTDPEFADFLATVPQAGRILRPLCRMLGVELPAPLRREPRPRPARPKPPPKPQPIPFRVPLPKGLGLSRRKRYFGI